MRIRIGSSLGSGAVARAAANRLIENAIRPTKLGAKNWLFIGNVESGQKTAILYTIVENCRRLGINPKEYLEDVLNCLSARCRRAPALAS